MLHICRILKYNNRGFHILHISLYCTYSTFSTYCTYHDIRNIVHIVHIVHVLHILSIVHILYISIIDLILIPVPGYELSSDDDDVPLQPDVINGSANFYCYSNSIQKQTLACSTFSVPIYLFWKSTRARGNQVIFCIFCIFCIFLRKSTSAWVDQCFSVNLQSSTSPVNKHKSCM